MQDTAGRASPGALRRARPTVPRLASKGDARGRGQAPAPRRLRPSLALGWPCAHMPGKPAPARARPGIRAAADQQHRVLPGPPRPRPPPPPRRAGASSESARPGAADCQGHSAGGGGGGRRPPAPSRKLRVGAPPKSTVAARGELTASQVATGGALSDDAADCGFAVPSRDRSSYLEPAKYPRGVTAWTITWTIIEEVPAPRDKAMPSGGAKEGSFLAMAV